MNSPAIGRIHRQWNDFAKSGDVDGLIGLYSPSAVLETPLIPAILDCPSGVLRGHDAIRHFFEEGTKRRPNELVRWYRADKYFTDGKTLIWEYPRETPSGDQVDILEVMEIERNLVQHHRIYWGWFGTELLIRTAVNKAIAAKS